jgi:hypothetical protein
MLEGRNMLDINRTDFTECSVCKKTELTDRTYGIYYPRFPRIGKKARYISHGLCPDCFQKQMEEI